MKKIKQLIKTINKLIYIGAVATSLLYMAFVILSGVIYYLHNRPIKTAVLCVAMGVLLMWVDDLQDQVKQHNSRQNRTARRVQTVHNR